MLEANCVAPQPQGPFTIKNGTAINIPFKNVFATAATFNFSVDNSCFAVKANELIPAKKSITLTVTHRPGSAAGARTGRLLISHPSNASWVYYLKAV